MEPGTLVGSKRWPYAHAHPDCWNRPWSGTLLSVDDPRAWKDSVALGPGVPSKQATAAHVAWCRAQGGLSTVPVLWHFDGPKGPRIYWERPEDLRPYAVDVADWETELAAARAALAPRKAA